MTAAAKMTLAKSLLRCPTVLDRQNRDAIVNDLSEEIRLGVSRSDSALLDVQNIIGLALNYEGGLNAFIEGVRLFEGNSLPMAEVDRVLGEIGWVRQGVAQVCDTALATGMNIMLELCGPTWKPYEVFLPHAKPRDAAALFKALIWPVAVEA